MYGLPKNFSGEFLVGRTFEYLCFAENMIVFHFGEKISISAYQTLMHEKSAGAPPSLVKVPCPQSDLMGLLGQSIVRAVGDEDGTLAIDFDSGHRVCFLDSSSCYESYVITHGDREIVV